MALFRKIEKPAFQKIGLWHITEGEDFLLRRALKAGFSVEGLSDYSSVVKRRQWLAVRCLISEIDGSIRNIIYDERGIPYTGREDHISLSHSLDFAAVIIDNSGEAGIDIQHFSPKTWHIRERFCSGEELRNLNSPDAIKQLHIIWAAKEAVYKKMKIPGLEFRKDILTNAATIRETEEGILPVQVKKGQVSENVAIQYEIIGEYAFAFTLNT